MTTAEPIVITEKRLGTALSYRLLRAVDEEIVRRGLQKLQAGAMESRNQLLKEAPNPPNANQKHAARVVLRSAMAQSVGNWIAKQVKDRLAKLEIELESEMRAKDPSANPEKLNKLFVSAQKRINNAFGQLSAQVQNQFKQLAQAIHDKAVNGLKDNHGLEAANADLSNVLDTPVLGATIAEHFKKMAEDLLFRFKAAVRTGAKAEDGLDRMVSRVTASEPIKAAADAIRSAIEVEMRLMETTENSVNKVIQAAISAFGNEIEQAVGEETEADNMGWQWIAVMDARTCEQCEFYDGKRWNGEYEPVEDGPEFPDEPPLHFNCRCSLVPSNLSEDGAKQDQSFDDYLSQYSRSEQEQAFGKETLRAYRRGDITSNQLIGQKDNLLTLEQFKEAL